MEAITCCMLTLVCTMLVASASHANPATEMKSSPLFAAALELSVARLEGRTLEKEELLATTTPGCEATPDAPYTQQPVYTCGWQCDTQWETCNYTCQGATCYNTCQYTCGQSTCASTCANTCVSTCQSTCSSCGAPYVKGTVFRPIAPGWWSTDWTGTEIRTVREAPYGYSSSFGTGGGYLMRCSYAARDLVAAARFTNGLEYYGLGFKRSQGDETVTVDIYTQVGI